MICPYSVRALEHSDMKGPSIRTLFHANSRKCRRQQLSTKLSSLAKFANIIIAGMITDLQGNPIFHERNVNHAGLMSKRHEQFFEAATSSRGHLSQCKSYLYGEKIENDCRLCYKRYMAKGYNLLILKLRNKTRHPIEGSTMQMAHRSLLTFQRRTK